MSSAGQYRRRFCESRGEEEDGHNADVDEDDEEFDMAIRDKIKRRAERLLNVHQKVEDGKIVQTLWLTEACVHNSRNFFLFHLFHVNLWKITENHYRLSNAICPWIVFLRRQVA